MFSLPSPDNVQIASLRERGRESVPPGQPVSRHGPWNSLLIQCVASVTEPKFYAFYPIDGTWVILAPNGNNLPEELYFPPKWVPKLTPTWWRHYHLPRYWPFALRIYWSPVNSLHKGQRRGALMFSLICAWINGWVNNCEAGNLRRHCDHFDVTVMDLNILTVIAFKMSLYEILRSWLLL